MTPHALVHHLVQRFGSAIIAAHGDDKHPRVHIPADSWRAVAESLYHDDALAMDWLACLSGVDYVASEQLGIVVDLRSFRHGHTIAVKVLCPRATPRIPTVCDLWPAAEWHEREAYDMYGLEFTGHPDLRRILLPDDWEGFPLRKDYVFPRQYEGIPGTYELDWQQKPDYPK